MENQFQNIPMIPGNRIILGFKAILTPHKVYDYGLMNFGSTFCIPLSQKHNRYFFTEPKIIEEIFKTSSEILQAGVANSFFKPFLGNNSLLVLDGENHLKERKMLIPSLMGERIGVYNSVIENIVIVKMNYFKSINTEVDLMDVFTESTLEVILKTVFGAPDGEIFDNLRSELMKLRAMTDRVGSLGIFFPFLQVDLGAYSPFGKFLRTQKRIDQLIYKLIELKKNSPRGTDILSILIDTHYEDGTDVAVSNIRDQLLTMLLAGQDTTTHSLAWTLRWIGIYPEKFNHLINELKKYKSAEEASTNEYLDWVVKESLRIYPVFSLVGRVAKTDLVIGNIYKIKKGSMVSPLIYGVHHREDLYPNSFEFIPERFKDRRFTPFEYLPFGGGGRRCIGAAFALNQIKMTIATILLNYTITPLYKEKPKPIRQGVGLAPKGGVRVLVK